MYKIISTWTRSHRIVEDVTIKEFISRYKKKNDTQHNKINAKKKFKKIPSTQKMTSNPSQNMYELLIGENILSIGDKKT